MKSFQFEPITNIGDINSSSSDEEEGTEYKVKRILSGVSAVQNQSLADVLQNRCQACNFIKKRLQHRCFPMKFEKFLRAPLFTEHLYLVVASSSKQCKPMKKHWKFMLPRKKWYTWTVLLRLVFLGNEYSSEFFQILLAVPYFSSVAWKSQKQSSRGVL